MEFPAFYIALAVAVCAGLFQFNHLRKSGLVLILPYLTVNLIAETYGLSISGDDYWIYNIATTIEFAFYFYLYYKFIGNEHVRKRIKWLSAFYFPLCLINIFFIQGWNSFHSNSYLAGTVILIYISIAYLREVIINIETENPFRNPLFWITTGVLFFYIGSFFHLGLFEYIQSRNPMLHSYFRQLLNILNVILYCMYIIAFNVGNKR